MVSIFWSRSLLVRVLTSTPNHIQPKYRCPNYCCVQFRHTYLSVKCCWIYLQVLKVILKWLYVSADNERLTNSFIRVQVCYCSKIFVRIHDPAGCVNRTTLWRHCIFCHSELSWGGDLLAEPRVLLVLLYFHEWHLGGVAHPHLCPLMDSN